MKPKSFPLASDLCKGLALIEPIVGMAIICLLAAVALPEYQNYAIRAKVSEAILATSPCRSSISEMVRSATSALPGDDQWGCEARHFACTNDAAAAAPPTKYVQSIATSAAGVITVTTPSSSDAPDLQDAAGKTIALVPYVSDSEALAAGAADAGRQIHKWVCRPGGTSPMPRSYLPGSCRG